MIRGRGTATPTVHRDPAASVWRPRLSRVDRARLTESWTCASRTARTVGEARYTRRAMRRACARRVRASWVRCSLSAQKPMAQPVEAEMCLLKSVVDDDPPLIFSLRNSEASGWGAGTRSGPFKPQAVLGGPARGGRVILRLSRPIDPRAARPLRAPVVAVTAALLSRFSFGATPNV